jgi:hypothetical protein
MAARRSWASALLRSKNIAMPAAARTPVTEGRVDPRLLIDIAGMASQRSVTVAAFGDSAPGASPGVALLRSADLAATGSAADRSPAAQVRWISCFLQGSGATTCLRASRRCCCPQAGPACGWSSRRPARSDC